MGKFVNYAALLRSVPNLPLLLDSALRPEDEAVLDQVTWEPLLTTSFFLSRSLTERHKTHEAVLKHAHSFVNLAIFQIVVCCVSF